LSLNLLISKALGDQSKLIHRFIFLHHTKNIDKIRFYIHCYR